MNINSLTFDEKNLIPVLVQHASSGKILMFAFANIQALEKTQETGFAHFWSRSRKKLWKKGEESGNVLRVVGIKTDCDSDAVLYLVQPTGNTCHTGKESCFFRGDDYETDAEFCMELESTIAQREKHGEKTSYIHSLFEEGLDRIVQKVGRKR